MDRYPIMSRQLLEPRHPPHRQGDHYLTEELLRPWHQDNADYVATGHQQRDEKPPYPYIERASPYRPKDGATGEEKLYTASVGFEEGNHSGHGHSPSGQRQDSNSATHRTAYKDELSGNHGDKDISGGMARREHFRPSTRHTHRHVSPSGGCGCGCSGPEHKGCKCLRGAAKMADECVDHQMCITDILKRRVTELNGPEDSFYVMADAVARAIVTTLTGRTNFRPYPSTSDRRAGKYWKRPKSHFRARHTSLSARLDSDSSDDEGTNGDFPLDLTIKKSHK